jgi:hypothetical protein
MHLDLDPWIAAVPDPSLVLVRPPDGNHAEIQPGVRTPS